MSFLRDTRLTSFLERSQAEHASRWMRVLGIVCLTALSVLAVAALAALLLDAPTGRLERVWYVALIVLVLWYDVGFFRKTLRRSKRNSL